MNTLLHIVAVDGRDLWRHNDFQVKLDFRRKRVKNRAKNIFRSFPDVLMVQKDCNAAGTVAWNLNIFDDGPNVHLRWFFNKTQTGFLIMKNTVLFAISIKIAAVVRPHAFVTTSIT